MNPTKTQAIQDWPQPKTVTKVQEFLGFVNFYKCFIKGFLDIVIPFTALIKKNRPFEQAGPEKKAFQILKKEFGKKLILAIFYLSKQIVIETDISDYVIEACFSQLDEQNRLYLMAFYFRKMSLAEVNYDIHDKELLVIITAF